MGISVWDLLHAGYARFQLRLPGGSLLKMRELCRTTAALYMSLNWVCGVKAWEVHNVCRLGSGLIYSHGATIPMLGQSFHQILFSANTFTGGQEITGTG